jgi:uncharacterized protein YkwD
MEPVPSGPTASPPHPLPSPAPARQPEHAPGLVSACGPGVPIRARQVVALQRAAGNRAVGAWLTNARRAQVQRVGLLSGPETPPPNASAAYKAIADKATFLREQYTTRKTGANGAGSILDWLEGLPFIASGWGATATEEDARALFNRLLADIDKTQAQWREREATIVDALTQYVTSEAVKIKAKADDRTYLLRRWVELGSEDGKLSHPGARQGLSAGKRDEMVALFRRLRSAAAELIGHGDAKRRLQKPIGDVRAELLAATNAYRKTGGSSKVAQAALTLDDRLNRAAQGHAVFLAQEGATFAHEGEGRSQAHTRISAEKYYWSTSAENIAQGQESGTQAVQSWIKSPGHEANLVNPSAIHVGFGYAIDAIGQHLWVQVFGAPRA